MCDERLRAVDRHGVEIDICPACKGVWLDRGELDKILEMASASDANAPAAAESAGPSTQPVAPLASPAQPVNARPAADDPRYNREPERRKHDDGDDDDEREHGRGRTDEHGESREQQGRGRGRRGSWLSDILGGFGGD